MKICNNRIKNLYNNQDYQNDRELSVILTFNNEGIEVEKTLQSVFSTTKHTNIILVNDASDDNYDYEGLTKKYKNVKYIYNKTRQGVAESRNIGVRNSSTEYCVLLDAHMRFYDDNWDLKIIDLLKKYNNSILCSHTVVIKKNLCDYYINEDDTNNHIISYGANINLDYTKERCFRHQWNYIKLESNEDNLIEIPSVLGACYCFTKSHWNYIHGLNGLIKYGLDEALMSMKTWMMGGKCYLINDFWVGHLYRDKLPYQVSQSDVAFNEYFCIKLFVPENEQEKYIKNLYNRLTDTSKKELDEYIKKYTNVIKIEKNYFNNYKKYNFEWFINFNDIKAS
jgi:glycosyltransferase involved in cell wall biosynthesis